MLFLADEPISQAYGQHWTQIVQFGIAFLLSCAIGLEREIRQKAAGLRTYTVVGIGSALFTLVSKYGFTDVLRHGEVVLDPSRVVAQIVSGLGFIGAGVIFVQRGSVKGLTSAATIWLTAAVGAASAAGLPILAVLTTVAYFAVSYVVRPLAHRLPWLRSKVTHFRITYSEGRGLLRDLVDVCTEAGFSIIELTTVSTSAESMAARTLRTARPPDEPERARDGRTVQVILGVMGRGSAHDLSGQLAALNGVLAIAMTGGEDD